MNCSGVAIAYVCFNSGKVQIQENPVCILDAVKAISEATGDSSDAEVRLTGVNVAALFKSKFEELSLDTAKWTGPGWSIVSAVNAVAPRSSFNVQLHRLQHIFTV